MFNKVYSILMRISDSPKFDKCMKWFMIFFVIVQVTYALCYPRAFVFSAEGDASDFFYNYSAGFVRRGLMGSILIWLHRSFGADIMQAIQWVCIFGYVLVICYFIRMFCKRRYNWYILVTCFMLGSVVTYSLPFFRRDFILFVVLIFACHTYNRLSLRKWLILGNVVCVIAILSHEAFFFYSVPILYLMTTVKCRSYFRSALYWIPSVIAFMLCCIYKGTPEMGSIIWETIRHEINPPLENEEMPYLLTFMGHDSTEVMRFHLWLNFSPLNHLIVFINLFSLWGIYILSSDSILAFSPQSTSISSRNNLAHILLFQWLCLLPMWTVLSCDYLRIALYWTMSSFIVWFSLTEQQCSQLLPNRLNVLCGKTDRIIHLGFTPPIKNIDKLLCSFLLLTIGMTPINNDASIYFASCSTIAYQVVYQFYMIVKWICMNLLNIVW